MPFTFESIKKLYVNQTEMIYDLRFHPSKPNLLALSTIEGDIQIIDITAENNNNIMSFRRHHKGTAIRRVRFINDELLVTAAKTIKIMDLNNGKTVRKIENDGSKIYSLLIIDNYLLCIGDDDGHFKVWDYRVDRGIYMNLKECDDYISDLDISSDKRVVIASSGEGTLSAFNIRAKKLEPPQSELFDAGFQCTRFVEAKGKVLVGAEDSAINIFNINQWGNISDRFPIRGHSRGSGKCSIDNIELLTDDVIVVGASDGNVIAVNILPNKVLCQIYTHESSVECMTVDKENQNLVSTHDNFIHLYHYNQLEEGPNKGTKENFFEGLPQS